jgi:hypothetical protein
MAWEYKHPSYWIKLKQENPKYHDGTIPPLKIIKYRKKQKHLTNKQKYDIGKENEKIQN